MDSECLFLLELKHGLLAFEVQVALLDPLGLQLRVWDLRLRASGLGDLGFKVCRFRIWDLELRV